MKKIIFSLFILAVSTIITSAQGPVSKGQKQLNAGLGFDNWGIPLYLGLDYGVHPDVTVGGELAFASEYGYSLFAIKGNGNYHFNNLLEINRSWDVYAGVNLGIYIGSWSNPAPGYKNSHSDFELGIQLGGRYYFSPKWGVNLEFTFNSFPNGKVGVSYRF